MAALLTGLDEAQVVRTPVFEKLDDTDGFVIPRHEILVIDGDHGVGKTTLTEDFASRQTLPVHTVELGPKQSSRDMVRVLHAATTTGDETDDLPERDLQDDLLQVLAGPRIVIVRNAQRLGGEGAAQLEWLHSHRHTAWTLILEGGPGTAAAVERDALLRGRVASTLTVPTLTGTPLLRALQGMHPLFLGADTDLLAEINARVCRGVLRHWARILQIALHIQHQALAKGREVPVLDRTFAKAVLAQLPTTITKKRT